MRYRIGQKIVVIACCEEDDCYLRGKTGIFQGYDSFNGDLCNLLVDDVEETSIRVTGIRPTHTVHSTIEACR